MRAMVRRYGGKSDLPPGRGTTPVEEKLCQVSISDNYAMLSGPKFRHIADGQVQSTSAPYTMANYHLCVVVLVTDNHERGLCHTERWYIRLLEVDETGGAG